VSYLTDLVGRVLEPGGGLRPRVPSLFEPMEGPAAVGEAPGEAPVASRGPHRAGTAGPVDDEVSETFEPYRPGAPASAVPGSPTRRRPRRRGAPPRRQMHEAPHASVPGEAPTAARERPRGVDEPVFEPPARERAVPAPSAPRRGLDVAPAAAPRRAPSTPVSERPDVAERVEQTEHADRVERTLAAPAPADVLAIAAAATPGPHRPARPRRAAGPPPDSPAVRVTIGRIDVRPAESPLPAPEPERRTGPEPLRLEDYLRQRDAGER
jgi:hypothetical protein